jgi:glycosyltransferase involved in cell wall biosynthesis
VAGNIYPDNPRSLTKIEIQTPHNEGVIEWLGHVDDMPALLKQSIMVVLPSYYGEGVPKVLLEAAAIGRAIVTCDAPGCRETVEHEVNGLLVSPQSPEELAQAMEQLISDPKKCLAYGQAGRKRVKEDFNTEHVVAQTLRVYEDLLS